MKKAIVLVFAVLAVFIVFRLYRGVSSSNTTSVLVTNKEVNPYRISFVVTGENEDSAPEIEVNVNDENLWNLIEKDRTYFVTYSWRNSETPTLDNIRVDDNKIGKAELNVTNS
jgi:hypothetical protein